MLRDSFTLPTYPLFCSLHFVTKKISEFNLIVCLEYEM